MNQPDKPSQIDLIGVCNFQWPEQFFAFQLHGIAALITNDCLLLADDMGLGKTVQMIAALRIMMANQTIEKALIIVPASLVRQWQIALREWAPEMRLSTVYGRASDRSWQWRVPARFFLTSYETFRQDFSGRPKSVLSSIEWDAVILDEAQKIKNSDTVISIKTKQIRRKRAYALTGTPLENNIEDLYSILQFLVPWRVKPKSSETDGDCANKLRSPSPYRLRITPDYEQIQLRRKKMEVLPQLPPKIIHDICLDMPEQQRRAYLRAEKEGLMKLRNKRVIKISHILALILRLKQICNACPETGQSAKFTDLESRIEQLIATGHRAIIFSQFTDNYFGCKAIAGFLQRFNPLVFTGAQSASQKAETIEEFKRNSDHGVLILSLRSGGLGLNLQDASYVFHIDRWWNPAVETQAEDRSHRLGQTVPVHVYRYLIADSIEDRINEILVGKRELFKSVVDDVSLDIGKMLTKKEFLKVLGLKS
ncbi:DEAD/DEAH box helicase [bacterium]|nr:DEAD/DEAH box helicase [bacterium]